MKRYLLIHYGEIGLKKANKMYFVEKLRTRVKTELQKAFKKSFSVLHTLGRLMVLLPDDFSEQDYAQVLKRIFGIKNFKFAFAGDTDLEILAEQIFPLLNEITDISTFRVKVKRSMVLPFNSVEAEKKIGALLLDAGFVKKVKLKDPDLIVDVEFFNDKGYFSFKKYKGAGGLSPSSQSRLVSLLSSGIDSPVAAYRMMKRGARIIFVHFHGYPYTDDEEMEQVKDLVKILSQYQNNTKLYLVPFGEFQKSVGTTLEIPGKVRTVLYRRMMLKIAEKIARKEAANGLITGDSFGQVASQTPENLFAVHDASSIPLYQPLISWDKEEIIELARIIGTYEISKLPCKDTCTMFMSKNPELKANVMDMREYEKHLAVDEYLDKVFSDMEILYF